MQNIQSVRHKDWVVSKILLTKACHQYMEMAYIEGGGTPNMMSIGRAMQCDKTGQTGVAKGAVFMRTYPKPQKALSKIVDRADDLGLIEW